MKKMHFIFKNGEEKVNDEIVNYIENNGILLFDITDAKIKSLLSSDTLHFERITEDYSFIIDLENGNKKCEILLKKEDITINVNLLDLNYHYKENYAHIEYVIESDPDYVKTIEFMY